MFKIYNIDKNYIDFLKKFDKKIACNKNEENKLIISRPYTGIVLKTINGFNYFVPMYSPKPKHLNMNNKQQDIYLIDDGKLGVLNLNNIMKTQ